VEFNGSPSNCCILGFHSAVNQGGKTLAFGIAEYDGTKFFTNIKNISVYSHEIAELINDPAVNNATPSWGHTGQVSGCQANLEVGDPLSGHLTTVATSGITFNPQEMAFANWFYPGTPNEGVNGFFSSNGTFKTAAAHCT
jgi:hypothetical protein